MTEYFCVIDVQKYVQGLNFSEIEVPAEYERNFQQVTKTLSDPKCLLGMKDNANENGCLVGTSELIVSYATKPQGDSEELLKNVYRGTCMDFGVFVANVHEAAGVKVNANMPQPFLQCIGTAMKAFNKSLSVKSTLSNEEQGFFISRLRMNMTLQNPHFVNNPLIHGLLRRYEQLN